jgi:hypothetical protein
MKLIECKVCKNEFYGRRNQIFCSNECKNKHYNQKTKLIYQLGRHGEGKIAEFQEAVYVNTAKVIKIDSIFSAEKELYHSEVAILRSDYVELANNYQKLNVEVERIRKRYIHCHNSAIKSEEQIELLNGLGKMLAPAINKVLENLGKTHIPS